MEERMCDNFGTTRSDFIVATDVNTLTFDQCGRIQIYMGTRHRIYERDYIGIKNAFSMPTVSDESPIPLKQLLQTVIQI